MTKGFISIISPVFNEEELIHDFYDRIITIITKTNYEYEIILINDGSTDKTDEIISNLAETDKNLKIINFSRNFGHQTAISAGIEHAAGDAAIIIDSDLQDPPEIIPQLITKWEEGYDIVNAKRKSRKDSFLKIITARIFYKFLNLITKLKISEDIGDFRLISSDVIYTMSQIKEKERYIRGLTNWIGYKQTEILYDRDERKAGQSKYNLIKMIQLALNGIYSFSNFPITFLYLKILFDSVFTTFLILLSIINSIIFKFPNQLIYLIIMVNLIITILFIGLTITEYIRRIYIQTLDRPLYIIKEKINF